VRPSLSAIAASDTRPLASATQAQSEEAQGTQVQLMPNTPVTLPPAEFDRIKAEYEADGEVMPDHYIRAIPTEERGYEVFVATKTEKFELSGDASWEDVSRAADGEWKLVDGPAWETGEFGSIVIATNEDSNE
jgi:hypothetical protein